MLKHKLPALFKEIIRHEKKYPQVGNVIGFAEHKTWVQRKRELINAADKFVQRQRSGK